MQLSVQEREIIKICIKELKSTLGNMAANEADLKVSTIATILEGLIKEAD